MATSQPHFDVTSVGYREAKRWLKDTGQYEKIKHELSQDGFALVHLANALWEEQHRQ